MTIKQTLQNRDFRGYLKSYGEDVKIRDGFILLFGPAYEKREFILSWLQKHYPRFRFRPDFIADMPRIEYWEIEKQGIYDQCSIL